MRGQAAISPISKHKMLIKSRYESYDTSQKIVSNMLANHQIKKIVTSNQKSNSDSC